MSEAWWIRTYGRLSATNAATLPHNGIDRLPSHRISVIAAITAAEYVPDRTELAGAGSSGHQFVERWITTYLFEQSIDPLIEPVNARAEWTRVRGAHAAATALASISGASSLASDGSPPNAGHHRR